jgi:hypothetical protein
LACKFWGVRRGERAGYVYSEREEGIESDDVGFGFLRGAGDTK